MRLQLHDGYHLGAVREGDQAAFVEHFLDRELADSLLRIPFPYTPADAEFWVRSCTDLEALRGQPHHFAIRRADGRLIGGIGLQVGRANASHRAELGYWLARADRGRGVARAATRLVVRYGFAELGLKRIEATTALGNVRSQRVLETAGFAREGFLARYHNKNGALIDVYLYSILTPPAASSPA